MGLSTLHVTESLSQDAGSPAIALPGLMDSLNQAKIRARMICADFNGGVDLPVEVDRRSPNAAIDLQKADVVHIHGWHSNGVTRAAALAAYKARVPYVISAQGMLTSSSSKGPGWRQRLRIRFREKKLIDNASALLAGNDHEAEVLRRERMVEHITVLPYGLCFEDYHGETNSSLLPEPLAGRCLLLMGPVYPKAGHAVLLRAFAELGREADDWYVIMAGREIDHWRKSLEAAVRRKGGADRARFALANGVAIQRSWLARASLSVSPTLFPEVPITTMQSLACGVPVLATRVVQPPALPDGVSVCDPTRTAIKDGLRELLCLDAADLAKRGEATRAPASDVFDWSNLSPRYIEIYQGLS